MLAPMINSCTKVLIQNIVTHQNAWLDLPYADDELEELLEIIGVKEAEEDDTSNYDLLMNGECPFGYQVIASESDYLSLKNCYDLERANELVDRIESISTYDREALDALLEDGEPLENAIDIVEDGDVEFRPGMTLEDLAQELVEEQMFDVEFLMNYIDYEALGRALADDGYREVSRGVLRTR